MKFKHKFLICLCSAGLLTGIGTEALPNSGTVQTAGSETPTTDILPGTVTMPATPAEFLELVQSRNHSLAAERFRTAIAEAELKASKVITDPELTFEGSEDVFSLELGYTIEFGRKRAMRIRQARTFAEMERYEVELFAGELRLAAMEAYIEALAEAELLNLKKSSYNYMLELSRSDSLRLLSGEITANDARQSALEAGLLLAEVYEQEGEYLSALTILGFYAGISPDVLIVPTGDLNTDVCDSPLHVLIYHGLDRRIESGLAAKTVEMARRELAVVKSERKPDVDVFIGYERDWHGFLPRKHMLTGGVTVPLKFSSINKGSVRAAGLAVEQERRQEQGVRSEIEAEIASAYHVYRAAVRTYDHFRSGLMDEARKVLDGFVYEYRAGETDILEVLIAQRTYNETREQFIETEKNARTAAVNLLHACGIYDYNGLF